MEKKMTRAARRRKQRNRRILLTVALMMLVAVVSIGGTIAWLTDSTKEVVNTFSSSDIDIDLTETANLDLKMVLGKIIKKDPVVTVKKGSEACYVFVVVSKDNADNFLEYSINAAWKKLDGYENVYYIAQADLTEASDDAKYSVLTGDQVKVSEDVTKQMMNGLTTDTYPELTFQAYAIQQANGNDTFTVTEAWDKLGITVNVIETPTSTEGE